MDKAAEEVQNAIQNGIDLIREGAGITASLATFIIQILATLVLFLIVRFLLWNRITAMLDKRKMATQEAIDNLNAIEAKTDSLKKEADTIISDAVNDANLKKEAIINDANLEKEEIISKAKIKADGMIKDAEEEISRSKEEAKEEIKEEIIEVAYELSKKITASEIDSKKNNEIIDQFFEGRE